ncbi:MAG: RDD family protein [Candidatus Bathyarchaeia archaeon]
MSTGNGQYDMNHWLSRLTAYIIDGIITGIIAAAIWFPLTLINGFANSYFVENWAWLGYSLIWGIIQVIYFTALEDYWGTSVGKRFLGFQVQQTSGAQLTTAKAFTRNISKIFWPLLILDCIVSAFSTGTDKRQKFTDRIAQTTVILITHAFVTPPPLKTLPT